MISGVSSSQVTKYVTVTFPSAFSPLLAFPVAVIVLERPLLASSVLIGIFNSSKSILSISLSPVNTLSIATGLDSTNILIFTKVPNSLNRKPPNIESKSKGTKIKRNILNTFFLLKFPFVFILGNILLIDTAFFNLNEGFLFSSTIFIGSSIGAEGISWSIEIKGERVLRPLLSI